ncbi:MAG: Gldg family protein, partial [Syntrophales bacterium]|nr:Gldg family protein [Syntrophales bacterium]
ATEFGQEKAIPLLAPERQQLAEYDITEMIHSATSRTKKKIGILSAVNLGAAAYPVETARAMGLGETGPKGPSALEQLKSHYDVTMLAPHADLRKLDAVMVVHPRNLPEQTIAALDRYVTGGGKLVVFQDPAFMADPSLSAAGSAYTPGQNGSNLNGLLAAWGCEMAPDLLAADPGLAPRAPAGPATLMTLKGQAISHEDGLSTGVSQVQVFNAGTLRIKAVPGIAAAVLLRTSETGYTVRAEGSFRSALEGEPVPDSQKAGTPAAGKSVPAVVVFSDVDMLTAAMTAGAPAGGNADLLLATMEGLTGSVSLASIKARGRIIRPFSAVDRMEENYEDATAAAMASLQAEIAAGERELNTLARKSQEGEESLLKEEILRSRKMTEAKIARAKEELAALQHKKRTMVENLFTKWKVFILLGGPALVLLIPAVVLAGRLFGRVDLSKRKPWTRNI